MTPSVSDRPIVDPALWLDDEARTADLFEGWRLDIECGLGGALDDATAGTVSLGSVARVLRRLPELRTRFALDQASVEQIGKIQDQAGEAFRHLLAHCSGETPDRDIVDGVFAATTFLATYRRDFKGWPLDDPALDLVDRMLLAADKLDAAYRRRRIAQREARRRLAPKSRAAA